MLFCDFFAIDNWQVTYTSNVEMQKLGQSFQGFVKK